MTKAEFAPWLKRLEKVKAPSKLSRSALESPGDHRLQATKLSVRRSSKFVVLRPRCDPDAVGAQARAHRGS